MNGNRKRKRGVPARIRRGVTALLVVCLGVALGLLFTPIFQVEEVWCEGNSRISQEEIEAAAQVTLGKNILTQRLSGIEARVGALPMVLTVNARRIFPNKIAITVQERTPAAYVLTGGQCAVLDLDGQILEILDGGQTERVAQALTPAPAKTEADSGDGVDSDDSENPEDSEDTEDEEDSEDTEDLEDSENDEDWEDTEDTEDSEDTEDLDSPEDSDAGQKDKAEKKEQNVQLPYQAPLIAGLELNRPEAGKRAESPQPEKLEKLLETAWALNDAGLLLRTTYLNLENLQDVTVVVENRLEVQLGNLNNIGYRCAFLAKVIDERISSTEHAVMDYRGSDLYVRPPEDGKARMAPRPTETPEDSEEDTDDPDSDPDAQEDEDSETEGRAQDSEEDWEEDSDEDLDEA